MALSFQATMAQEGVPCSQQKHGGFSANAFGWRAAFNNQSFWDTPMTLTAIVINPDEESTVKLIFYMYLYGYSTSDIAAALTELGEKTYLGNVNWTSNSIVQVLRNERHCGGCFDEKDLPPNYLEPQVEEEPLGIARRAFIETIIRGLYLVTFHAVQHLLNNAKYGNKSILPELRVIDSSILKGFVTVNPRWAGFKACGLLSGGCQHPGSFDTAGDR